MELQKTGIWVVCAVLFAFALLFVFKSGHPVKALLLSVFSGLASLFAVNLLSQFTGVSLAVNEVSLGIAAVGGIPGVVLMLLTGTIMV